MENNYYYGEWWMYWSNVDTITKFDEEQMCWRQFCAYTEEYYYEENKEDVDQNKATIIHSEEELRTLLQKARKCWDDEESARYTEKEIRQMIKEFNKRKTDFIENYKRRITASEKRRKELQVPISELI